MQSLEATIALALTLAALATIVTIIIEAGMRTARMRKKNLVEVIKLINKELQFGPMKLDPVQRWYFIERAISNPVNATTASLADVLSKKLKIPAEAENLLKPNNISTINENNINNLNTQLYDILNLLGTDKGAGVNIWKRIAHYFRQLFGDPIRSSLYDKVSLEHVLRRLAEVDVVQEKSLDASDQICTELNRLARKWEEYGSATSANFKRYAQAWSMFIGIALAVLANIDGLRIYNAYLANPELANTMIAQHEQIISDSEYNKKLREEFEDASKKLDKMNSDVKNAIDNLKQAEANLESEEELKILREQLSDKKDKQAKAQIKVDNLVNPDQVADLLQSAQLQYTNMTVLGVPMGWGSYPDCPYGDKTVWIKSDEKCQSIPKTERDPENPFLCWLGKDSVVAHVLTTASQDSYRFIKWLLLTVSTGMLIGLGAPFWFDVAKRLSQIRQAVRSNASGEERMSANNANGDPDERKKIVTNVVTDAAADALLMPPENQEEDESASTTSQSLL